MPKKRQIRIWFVCEPLDSISNLSHIWWLSEQTLGCILNTNLININDSTELPMRGHAFKSIIWASWLIEYAPQPTSLNNCVIWINDRTDVPSHDIITFCDLSNCDLNVRIHFGWCCILYDRSWRIVCIYYGQVQRLVGSKNICRVKMDVGC